MAHSHKVLRRDDPGHRVLWVEAIEALGVVGILAVDEADAASAATCRLARGPTNSWLLSARPSSDPLHDGTFDGTPRKLHLRPSKMPHEPALRVERIRAAIVSRTPSDVSPGVGDEGNVSVGEQDASLAPCTQRSEAQHSLSESQSELLRGKP